MTTAARNVRPIPIDFEPIQRLAEKLSVLVARRLFRRRGRRFGKPRLIAMDRISVRRVSGSYGVIRVAVAFGGFPAGTGRSFLTGGKYTHTRKLVRIIVSEKDAKQNSERLGEVRTVQFLARELFAVLSHELTHASEPASVMRKRAVAGIGSSRTLKEKGRTAYWQDPIEVHARTQVAVHEARESARVVAAWAPFLLENRQAFFDAVMMRTKSLRPMKRFYTPQQYQKVLKTIYAVLAEEGYFL